MVAVGVEWAECSEPVDAHADLWPGRRKPGVAELSAFPAGRETGKAADRQPAALADPERRVAEYHRHRAAVEGALAWAEAVPGLRRAWEELNDRYGAERGEPAPRPADGSWRGAGGRTLDAVQNAEVDRGCARIREAGERAIVPGVRAVEAEDPARRLAGFEHRFKDPDRLKEKVAERMRTKGRPLAETLAQIPDVVRFTFQYSDAAYAAGALKDMKRLEARGFTQVERRNTWESDQYKGINARWREPESGVTFEVQFHTQASLDAKELTHKAYERIRSITDQTPEADQETSELKQFQRRVNSMIPIPPGVSDIDDYPPGGK